MSRRRRLVRPDEKALWDQVNRATTRLRPDPAPATPEIAERPRPAPRRSGDAGGFDLRPFRMGEGAATAVPGHDLAPGLSETLAEAPVRMDRKAYTRLRRGQLTPEARIDLHGMTLAQAQPALANFVATSHARGLRLVLVITGKGKDRDPGGPIPTRHGVLRHQVPQWLAMPPLSAMVLDVREAHRKHGGQGALYVYLRRRR